MAEPDLITPKTAESLPHGANWIYEPKWDGYRLGPDAVPTSLRCSRMSADRPRSK
jgi:ATP-dependent DNA ligase